MAPRQVDFPGSDDPRVVGYLDVLEGRVRCGPRVAIVGAGGIGFDVAEFLVHEGPSTTLDPGRWMAEWGVDPGFQVRMDGAEHVLPVDQVVLCAGQVPRRPLLEPLQRAGQEVDVIGGGRRGRRAGRPPGHRPGQPTGGKAVTP